MITAICTALALLASPVGSVAVAPEAARSPASVAAAGPGAALRWGSCEGTATQAAGGTEASSGAYACAVLRVPVDHRDPARGALDLPLIRVTARDRDARVGTLVLQPGGPGGSGVAFVRDNYADLPDELRDRFDVVGYDARGVGAASRVRCWDDARYAHAFNDAAGRPGPDAIGNAVTAAGDFDAACARESPDLLPYLGTGYVARDLDLVRAALGEEQISFYGRSFGTYIGAVYADLFPGRVRAMVLDGAYDPGAYTHRPYEADLAQFVALDQAAGRFLRWCAELGKRCPFGAGDPEGAFDRLLRDLDADPVTVPGRGTVRGYTLVHRMMFALNGGREDWPRLAAALALAGTRDPSSFLLAPPSSEAFAFLTPNVVAECNDRAYPPGEAELAERLRRAAAAAPLLGPAMAYGPPAYDHSHAPACTRWPAERVSGHDGPFHATGSAPALVLGTTGDPDTVYQDAVTLAGTLADARLLTFEAEGHTAFGRSRCARGAAVAYLVTGTLPPPGLVCADERQPDLSSGSAFPDGAAAPGTFGADTYRDIIGRPDVLPGD